ncbi:hypothetical protein [Novosphingobium sp.]|uniref:hypothetical protein n=1 Tax=Novosphingobium sp. TaxID=1874826 RepID=UPI003341366B
MKNLPFIMIALVALPNIGLARPVNNQGVFDRGVKSICQSRHIKWISDGDFDDIIGDYQESISPKIRNKIKRLANYKRYCSSEQFGLECEWDTYLSAFRNTNHLADFTAWVCHHVKCREPGDCKIQ